MDATHYSFYIDEEEDEVFINVEKLKKGAVPCIARTGPQGGEANSSLDSSSPSTTISGDSGCCNTSGVEDHALCKKNCLTDGCSTESDVVVGGNSCADEVLHNASGCWRNGAPAQTDACKQGLGFHAPDAITQLTTNFRDICTVTADETLSKYQEILLVNPSHSVADGEEMKVLPSNTDSSVHSDSKSAECVVVLPEKESLNSENSDDQIGITLKGEVNEPNCYTFGGRDNFQADKQESAEHAVKCGTDVAVQHSGCALKANLGMPASGVAVTDLVPVPSSLSSCSTEALPLHSVGTMAATEQGCQTSFCFLPSPQKPSRNSATCPVNYVQKGMPTAYQMGSILKSFGSPENVIMAKSNVPSQGAAPPKTRVPVKSKRLEKVTIAKRSPFRTPTTQSGIPNMSVPLAKSRSPATVGRKTNAVSPWAVQSPVAKYIHENPVPPLVHAVKPLKPAPAKAFSGIKVPARVEGPSSPSRPISAKKYQSSNKGLPLKFQGASNSFTPSKPFVMKHTASGAGSTSNEDIEASVVHVLPARRMHLL